jgi:Holliday junction resolvase
VEIGAKDLSERAFCDSLERELTLRGFKVFREMPVPGGRIDIMAQRDDLRWVIEAKRDGSRTSVRHGVGQLIFYANYHRGARLFIASPDRPSDEMVRFMRRYGIESLQPTDAWDDGGPVIPFRIRGGDWWTTTHCDAWRCPRCRQVSEDSPAIMAFRGPRSECPEWAEKGWRLWRACSHCGFETDFTRTTRLYATDEQVESMTREFGPWRPLR